MKYCKPELSFFIFTSYERSAVKRNTSTRRQAATSQVSRANVFTSGMKWSDFTSKVSLVFGEDVKKRLRLLSEELLRLPLCGKMQKSVKRRLTSSFAIFLQKNGGSVVAHPGYAGTRRAGFDGGATRRRAGAQRRQPQ